VLAWLPALLTPEFVRLAGYVLAGLGLFLGAGLLARRLRQSGAAAERQAMDRETAAVAREALADRDRYLGQVDEIRRRHDAIRRAAQEDPNAALRPPPPQ
jgi:flagellar biosynthesis/type III secretory pathway M-ring protein FliF/YscJ